MNAASELSVSPWRAWASSNVREQAVGDGAAAHGDAFTRLLDTRWSSAAPGGSEQTAADSPKRDAAGAAVSGSEGSPPPASHSPSRRPAPRDEEGCDGAPPPVDGRATKDSDAPPSPPDVAAAASAEDDNGKEDAPTCHAATEDAAVPVPVPVCVAPPTPPAASLSGPQTPPDVLASAGTGAAAAGAGNPEAAGAAARPGAAPPVVADAGAPPAVAVQELAAPVQSPAGPVVIAPVADETAAGLQAASASTKPPAAVGETGSSAGGDVDLALALPQATESNDAGGQDRHADPGQDFAGGGAAGQTAATSRPEAGHAAPEQPRPAAAQLAEPLVRAARTGVQRVEIALEPAALGRVEVRLDFAADGRMSALIMADSRQALDALRADAQTLTRALADAGIDGGGLNFGLRQRDPGSEGGGFTRAFGTGGGTACSPGAVGPAAPARAVPGSYASPPGRLDIRA